MLTHNALVEVLVSIILVRMIFMWKGGTYVIV